MGSGISVIGNDIRTAQCALTLAEMGFNVNLITPTHNLNFNGNSNSSEPSDDFLGIWPLLLRTASHPRIKIFTNTKIKGITGKPGNWVLKLLKDPRYVSEELCTGCGKCEEVCSVKVQSKVFGRKVSHSAIHSPVIGLKTVPSAFYIEKEGISPCRSDCPLGINVQGYIALISKGKVDKARDLIDEIAPMAGILGRLCTHPCESNCARGNIDSPVFIKALHRYAADNATKNIVYNRKSPPMSHKEKIAIIGSGPAGLAAAWELARRGYSPTIFESHSVIGGMLATGIPRFRLPKEIREKEVEAIKALGVDIKTGVTVGRDVMYKDLVDRGYKAFFLAIGAQQNNKLNIPGEDLNGVLDSISLLFSLNLKVGVSVGSEVIVVGGGNSAVDSARSAKRVSKGDVRILCVTEKMTAVQEDVEEAIKEGIIIDYNITPIEILGDGNNVTGVHCQKVKNVTFEPDGKINLEYIPGSDIFYNADRVVVSIGQRPNSSVLNIKNLQIGNNATITADPLTLETNISGVFAGGDAVTGSNSVVNALASGLRAAESIDRYLRSHDLRKDRTTEKPIPVKVNLDERKPSPYKRANIPILPFSKRKGNYEETNLGFKPIIAKREAERCLNCSICCECLECEHACELKAINHNQTPKSIEVEASAVINIISLSDDIQEIRKTGIYNLAEFNNKNISGAIAQGSSIALTAALELKSKQAELVDISTNTSIEPFTNTGLKNRTVVFLCRCGDSISSVLDFEEITQSIFQLPGVYSIQELAQACTPEGAKIIKSYLEKEKIAHAVLAACRCCNMEQICFSCTDRRVICQNNLSIVTPTGVNIEYSNIREQCAWIHRDDPEGATRKAVDLISASVTRAEKYSPVFHESRKVSKGIQIIGRSLAILESARQLSARGYDLSLIHDVDNYKTDYYSDEVRLKVKDILNNLEVSGIVAFPWPQSIVLSGAPGKFEITTKYGSKSKIFEAGAIIVDLMDLPKQKMDILSQSNLFGRLLSRYQDLSRTSSVRSPISNSFSIKETAGIFLLSGSGSSSVNEQIALGDSAAARASIFVSQTGLTPRSSSAIVESKLCRGCGDCVDVCPLIELKIKSPGLSYAYIDPALCFGCGACVSICPTGAIKQPSQSEMSILASLESLFKQEEDSIHS